MNYTIHCTACGAIRSFERKPDDPQLTGEQVLEQASHSGGCAIAQGKSTVVEIDASNPANVVYTIS